MTTWEEFTQDVSMHGVRFAAAKKIVTLRRLIWLVLILAMLGYFCWSFTVFLIGYSKKLVTTKIKIEKARELQFPTVTICNRNMWAKSAILNSGFAALPEFLKDLHSNDPYGASLGYDYSLPDYAALAHKSPEEAKSFLSSAALSMEVTFLTCSIFESEVNCSDILRTVPTDGGFCFQFNSDGKFNATSAGRAGGVSFLLNANVDEYFTGPSSMSEGFTLTFHEAHQVPLTRELGIGVAPGTQTAVVLIKSQMSRLPYPADDGRSDCFDTDELPNPLFFFKAYSYSACMVECRTTYVLNICGCRHSFQPAINGSSLCTLPLMLNCSAPAMAAYSSDPEGLVACDCPDPCKDSEYEAQLSFYNFPSDNYVRQQNMSNGTFEFLKKNSVMVDIYYGKMSFRILDEMLSYGFNDMISNLGGTLGLCVGASILTIYEFIEFAILALSKALKGKKSSSSRIEVAPANGKEALS